MSKLPNFVPDERPTCIIVDIDGTVAEHNGRNIYDFSKVHTDIPRLHVILTVEALTIGSGVENVIFLTGRDDSCYKETLDWIRNNIRLFTQYELLMRKTGDRRKDYVVKEEIYRTLIEPKYNVMVAFEDRPSVILNCWQPLGIPVFNCGLLDTPED